MHRYLFPPSAGVHIISVGDDLEWPLTDDQCPTSREDCPTTQLPDDARRARRRSGDGHRRSSTTTQRCSAPTCLLLSASRTSVVSRLLLRHPHRRWHPSAHRLCQRPLFNGMHPTYGGSAARRQRYAMARPDEDEFGRVRRGGQSSPTLGGLSFRRAFGGEGDLRLDTPVSTDCQFCVHDCVRGCP